jgi:Ca-activated chloride channel family protein
MRSGRTWRLSRGFVGTLLAACALLALPHAAARPQVGTPAPDAGRMSMLFTALGKDGKFVEGLKAEDVRVTVDGTPREVLGLRRQSNMPLFLAVALDTSASQERMLPSIKVAADFFVRGMMVVGVDKAAVVTFGGDALLEQDITGDLQRVRRAIAGVQVFPPPGYRGGGVMVGVPGVRNAASTAIWDAVWLVSNDVLPRSLGPGRRAVLLVTDGVDTSSRKQMSDAVAAALQSEVVVYAVGIGDEKDYDGVEKGPLRKLAAQTGGRAFFPKKGRDLNEVFHKVAEELTSQYVLTFATQDAARDGSFHKVEIKLANPALRSLNVDLSYPQGFYAGNDPTAVKR